MPMVIPPKPWTGPTTGGYLSHQALIMRVRGSDTQVQHLFEADRAGHLKQVCTAPAHPEIKNGSRMDCSVCVARAGLSCLCLAAGSAGFALILC